ncbi:restriction endonuclease subunit S [Cyanobacterium sp. DS4]|uniref:restriction endonuclease subunit S n=1 Tax=Cyanobacterium sp. DS4 TaxID=2878255 RepID=UPI002E808882|nr:restriction endonuclease subunit S [Cyanobacterium sp. Dongsha4]WVL01844.1 restriction endonuclease subunit S [Cyanobacterium sp. Dongsha4]
MTKLKQQSLENSVPTTRHELWEKLLAQDYIAPPLITSVSANWLYEGDYRLDGCFYGSNAQTAKRIVTESIYPVETLGDITQDIFFPGRYKRIYARDKQAGYPFLSASEALQFRPTSDRYLAKDHLPSNSEKHFIEKDWILMTRSGTVGRGVISTKRLAKYFISDDLIRIIPKKFPLVGYLYAFLSSWIGQALVTKDQYGSAIKHLESHHIASVPVPILPESEQELIHNEILHVYQLREKANQLLDEANELLHQELGLPYFDESLVPYLPQPPYHPSHRPKMLPVKSFTTKLSELGDRFDCSFHVPVAKTAIELLHKAKYPVTLLENLAEDIFIPPRFKRIYVTKKYGVPFLQGSHLAQIRPYDLQYLSEQANKNHIEQCLIKSGYLLITRSGTIGRVMLVTSFHNNWGASEHLLRVVANSDKTYCGYLTAFMMTPYGQNQLTAKIYGAVVDELTEDDTKNIFIPEPPLDIQKEIGDKVVKAFEYKEQANLLEEQTINKLEKILEQD